jgi:hypothetical protein
MTTIAHISACLSLATAGLFLALLAVLHFIKPEIDPSWQPISEYAIGPYGWLMALAFLSAGLSCITLFMAIRSQARRIAGRIGLALLLVSAAGFVMAAVFTSDPATATPPERTVRGNLHGLGAILGGTVPLAAALLCWSLWRNPNWSFARRSLLWATILVWIGELAMIGSLAIILPRAGGTLGPQAPIGWPNRLMIVTYSFWLMVMALRAAQVCEGKAKDAADRM